LSALLDEDLKQFRNCELGQFRYVYLDARYEKVRYAGKVIDAAVLIATGVNSEGKREVLGVSVELSEAEKLIGEVSFNHSKPEAYMGLNFL
jgi:putative transposase